jgi:hypothetical protein
MSPLKSFQNHNYGCNFVNVLVMPYGKMEESVTIHNHNKRMLFQEVDFVII